MPETAKERKVDMLATSIDLIQKYDYLEEKFKKGYEFLRKKDLKALPLGRADIDGDAVFARCRDIPLCRRMPASMSPTIGILIYSYVVEGQEQFGCDKRAGLLEDAPYNEADDIVFFREPEQGGTILLKAGDCAVVAPEDAPQAQMHCRRAL